MDELIRIDQQLLLALNGSDNLFWDHVMCIVTKTTTWIPLALALCYVMVKNANVRKGVLFVLCVAVLIVLTDRISSGLAKPYFQRFRPTHEPALAGLVDVCDGYVGGLYGFFSSHAANTFGLCTFVSLVLRHWRATFTFIVWACLSSYSRIYLGLHYPGDILCGMLFGVLTGGAVYLCYRALACSGEARKQYYSSQYTSSGFLVDDCDVLPATFAATLVVVAICSLW